MSVVDDDNLVWVDLEMTGLDTDHDSILEIATVVTDKNLNVLAEGPVFAIRHEVDRLEAMDSWNSNQHRKSGLWDQVLASEVDHAMAEHATIEFLREWVGPGKSPLCGNTISQDRRFMFKYMPRLEAFFHYRNLDVSTLKELSLRWKPEVYRSFVKASKHEALADIQESIDELKHYREHFIRL